MKRDMEYCMGAKLIEVGVDPKAVIYRWTAKEVGDYQEWTYSAYWGDSQETLLREEAEKVNQKKS
jgi:hypothetical protein